jgi:hypothetical protein
VIVAQFWRLLVLLNLFGLISTHRSGFRPIRAGQMPAYFRRSEIEPPQRSSNFDKICFRARA